MRRSPHNTVLPTNPGVTIMCFRQSNAILGEASFFDAEFTVLVVEDAVTQLCRVPWHWLNFNDWWR